MNSITSGSTVPDLPTTVSFDFLAQADGSTKVSVDVELTPQSMLYQPAT